MGADSRLQKLISMLAEKPTDTFLRYALALEFDKQGQHEESLAEFQKLMEIEPPYVPAFFMSAQELARLMRMETAREVLRNGIEEARRQGNSHAAGEMSEFLANLGSAS